MYRVLKREFTWRKFSLNFGHENINHSVNKPWFAILPAWVLMLMRLAIAIFCLVIMGMQISNTKWYIFLTNWAFLLLTIAFVCLSLVSVIYVVQQLKGKSRGNIGRTVETLDMTSRAASARPDEESGVSTNGRDINENVPEQQITWYEKLAWFWWIVSANAGILVTIMYWSVIFEPPTNFRDISVHALNSLFVLFELFTCSIPVRLLHVVYAMIVAIIYTVFTVVYWAGGGVNHKGESFIYKVLDFENGNAGTAAGILIATILLLCPLVQLLLFGLYNLRCYLKKIVSPNDGDDGDRVRNI